MKTKALSALAILGGLLLAAPTGHAQAPAAPAAASAVLHADQPGTPAPVEGPDGPRFDPATVVSSDRRIAPGERIGPLRLDGKIDALVRQLGPGTLRKQGEHELFALQTWDAIGLWVQFDPGTGNVVWISVQTRTGGANPWGAHSTPDGIRLGTGRHDLLSVMGTPERTVTALGATSFYYDRRGIRFTLLDNGPSTGEVSALRVVWPSVPRGDRLIVPGKRISSIDVGAPVDRVIAILGGGYHAGEHSPGFHSYYWPHLGLSFVEQAKRVISVRAVSYSPADAAALRYSTSEGLGRNSTASQIRDVFGEPREQTASDLGGPFWIYRSRGIAFVIDEERKVKLVDVFPPEGR